MSKSKSIFAVVFLTIILTLSACNGGQSKIEFNGYGQSIGNLVTRNSSYSDDFYLYMNIMIGKGIHLYKISKATGLISLLCDDPLCDHTGYPCVSTFYTLYGGGGLFDDRMYIGHIGDAISELGLRNILYEYKDGNIREFYKNDTELIVAKDEFGDPITTKEIFDPIIYNNKMYISTEYTLKIVDLQTSEETIIQDFDYGGLRFVDDEYMYFSGIGKGITKVLHDDFTPTQLPDDLYNVYFVNDKMYSITSNEKGISILKEMDMNGNNSRILTENVSSTINFKAENIYYMTQSMPQQFIVYNTESDEKKIIKEINELDFPRFIYTYENYDRVVIVIDEISGSNNLARVYSVDLNGNDLKEHTFDE